MATRMIVTSQPDVACEVCGRRLLRGEQPDVFLAGGRRRVVCELCAPRASAEGWLREADGHAVSLPAARPRRGRSLFGRLRQQRERSGAAGDNGHEMLGGDAVTDYASPALLDTSPGMDSFAFGGTQTVPEGMQRAPGDTQTAPGGAQTARPVPAVPFTDEPAAIEGIPSDEYAQAMRALEVFNASEHPRRVAGVARSLGEPSVSVRPSDDGDMVTVVVAWELSWYRYEVDLTDGAVGASVVTQGSELSELPAEDRLANATAAIDGSLALIGSVSG